MSRAGAPYPGNTETYALLITPQTQQPAKWTFLYYGAGDNDLNKYIYDDVVEVERLGSDMESNLVVQLDQQNVGAARYLLQKKQGNAKTLDTPPLEQLGQINSSDPKNLSEFIQWGMKKFPAQHYMLVIADHGKGWKGCVRDDSHKGWMELPALKEALADAQTKTGKRLDVIGFDACLMASTEVAYELKEQAQYMVGSQELEGQEGWPYNHILQPEALKQIRMTALSQQGEIAPKQLVQALVARGSKSQNLPTLSAVDLSKMGNVADKLKGLKENLQATATPHTELRRARGEAQAFADFHDAYHFAEKITQLDTIQDPGLKDSAKGVMDALEEAVVAEQHSEKYPGAHGLTLELKFAKGKYKQTDLDKDIAWSDAVKTLNS